jgi:peptidylprolyl isomerase
MGIFGGYRERRVRPATRAIDIGNRGLCMRVRALTLVLPLLIVVACSSGNPGPTSPAAVSGTAASGSAAPDTQVADPVSADRLPTASGGFGDRPTLTFPTGEPPNSLQRVVLSAGTGPATQKGDWLITNYLGQVWGRTVFDNSYDKKTTAAFQIGLGKLVPGWDVALVDVPVGSRVLLSLPPADGYGAAGKDSAGIAGTDTLVFVVDIVGAVAPTAAGQTDAVPQPVPAGGPQVSGALGTAPTVSIPAGLAEPTTPSVTVLAKGTGAAVKNGQLLAQYVAVNWTGELAGSTWLGAPGVTGQPSTGPREIPVTTGKSFAGLIGVPLGSRVLVQLPATTNTKTGKPVPATASVLDLLAQAS